MDNSLAFSVPVQNDECDIVDFMSPLSSETEMQIPPYRVATEYTNIDAARMALDHSLFIKDHPSHTHLVTAKHIGSTPCMLAVDRHGTPVGVILVKKQMVYVYVNREYRLKGIGSLLVKELQVRRTSKFNGHGLIGAPGVAGWDAFFKKNKIACLSVVKGGYAQVR